MAIIIDDFSEYYGSHPEIAATLPSMKDYFHDEPMEDADLIVRYMLYHGDCFAAGMSKARDVFTGASTGIRDNGRTDGTYQWAQATAYYVKQYNLWLDENFVAHVKSKLTLNNSKGLLQRSCIYIKESTLSQK